MRLENTTLYDANLTVSFDRTGREVVVVAVKSTFALPEAASGSCLLADEQVPLIMADVFGQDPATDAPRFENDFAPFKPKCDVLVAGRAFAPTPRPVTELGVGLRIGAWSKRFTVHGSRIWLKGALRHYPSDKRPFTVQEIGYDHAFGGVDPKPNDPSLATTFEENPVGVGFYPHRRDREGLSLPNTAEFGNVVTDWIGPHRPMALGPLGRTWLPRRSFAGTYDDAWMEHRMPFLPDDFDNRYFQAAAADQQISYPQGGEPIELVHLVPGGRVTTTLPRLQILVNFERRSGRITQKPAALDTMLFLPEERRLCLTYRAHLVTERDVFELSRTLVHAPKTATQEYADG